MKKFNIFNLHHSNEFEKMALEIFQYQAENNLVYKEFLSHLHIDIQGIDKVEEIPFLPIQFFKSHKVVSSEADVEQIFLSSGTTGNEQSKHFVTDLSIYEESFTKGFEHFYGAIEGYTVLALLPSYLEREGSSLIYMANDFIKKSKNEKSGFYLNNLEELAQNLTELDKNNKKVLLVGVSFALLDLVEKHKFNLKNTIVMETGGMKGRRKELIRSALHQILREGFGVESIHS
ncbi:MAG: acyl transferase, partial [Lutibacter sp.]